MNLFWNYQPGTGPVDASPLAEDVEFCLNTMATCVRGRDVLVDLLVPYLSAGSPASTFVALRQVIDPGQAWVTFAHMTPCAVEGGGAARMQGELIYEFDNAGHVSRIVKVVNVTDLEVYNRCIRSTPGATGAATPTAASEAFPLVGAFAVGAAAGRPIGAGSANALDVKAALAHTPSAGLAAAALVCTLAAVALTAAVMLARKLAQRRSDEGAMARVRDEYTSAEAATEVAIHLTPGAA